MAENLRQSQANQFLDKRLSDLDDRIHKDEAISTFIGESIVAKGVVSFPTNPEVVLGTNATDLPIAWRFALPTKDVSGVVPVEIGTALPGFLSGEEARFSNEMHIDQDIDNNSDDPRVKELYERIGGNIVNRIKHEDGAFFSGIERRARINPDGTGIMWTQLMYAPQLLSSSQWIERYIDHQRASGIQVPEWLHESALGKNRRSSATALALSALHALRY